MDGNTSVFNLAGLDHVWKREAGYGWDDWRRRREKYGNEQQAKEDGKERWSEGTAPLGWMVPCWYFRHVCTVPLTTSLDVVDNGYSCTCFPGSNAFSEACQV